MSPSFRRTRRGRRTTTARVSRESASGIRWLCISLALNIAEAKVVPASLYGPLPPTNSMSFSLFCSSSLSSHRTYLYHFTIFFSLSSSLSFYFSIFPFLFNDSFIFFGQALHELSRHMTRHPQIARKVYGVCRN